MTIFLLWQVLLCCKHWIINQISENWTYLNKILEWHKKRKISGIAVRLMMVVPHEIKFQNKHNLIWQVVWQNVARSTLCGGSNGICLYKSRIVRRGHVLQIKYSVPSLSQMLQHEKEIYSHWIRSWVIFETSIWMDQQFNSSRQFKFSNHY